MSVLSSVFYGEIAVIIRKMDIIVLYFKFIFLICQENEFISVF